MLIEIRPRRTRRYLDPLRRSRRPVRIYETHSRFVQNQPLEHTRQRGGERGTGRTTHGTRTGNTLGTTHGTGIDLAVAPKQAKLARNVLSVSSQIAGAPGTLRKRGKRPTVRSRVPVDRCPIQES